MSPPVAVLVAVTLGAVGTLVRAEVGWWALRRTGSARTGTWLVNLVGAFALGAVVRLAQHGALSEDAARLVGLGLLGSFTTFSTWMVLVLRPDTVTGRRPVRDVFVHGLGMLVAGVAAAGAGVWLAAG